jgi:hypothetical protein
MCPCPICSSAGTLPLSHCSGLLREQWAKALHFRRGEKGMEEDGKEGEGSRGMERKQKMLCFISVFSF